MSLITVNEVNCKDCYKCVRYCPVKAIRVVDGHAEVDDTRCLGDGGCVQICPQHAKVIRSDVEVVKGLLASGHPVMASVAPSAAGVFGEEDRWNSSAQAGARGQAGGDEAGADCDPPL